jgi:hypothetical protein
VRFIPYRMVVSLLEIDVCVATDMLMRRWAFEIEWSGGRRNPVRALKPIRTLVQSTCRMPCADSRHQVIRTHPSLSPLAPCLCLHTYMHVVHPSRARCHYCSLPEPQTSSHGMINDAHCIAYMEDATRDTRDVASFVAA